MEGFFKVVILENDQEALLLDSILTERDVPHEISAPRAYHEEIMGIISDLRKET